ncbi:LADA_0G00540g1_1 [Lachancea dasiensis]|uniref:LADA_0G00540g1_1 n=1 Tax=Lachancea dasiensis TaxID=1072105 RepID=A0A1G4JQB4_9SACH|nr:LADA_0G00540g1_1 [Lachancea dasiensis]
MKVLRNPQVRHVYMHVDIAQDYGVLITICICTIIYGVVPAIVSILMGLVFDLLQGPEAQGHADVNHLMHLLTLRSMAILVTGVASAPICALSIFSWMTLGERQAFRVRRRLLHSYLTKSMAWYDANEQLSGDFTQLNRCVEELRSSSAEASGIIFQNFVTVVALLITAFYYSWSLTLVIMANSPLVVGFAIFCSRKVEKYAKKENCQTSIAADVMAWALNAAKMIRLCGTQELETEIFRKNIRESRAEFNKMALFSSLNYAILRFLTLCMFVQGFWYGNAQIKNGKLTPGDVITCFSACILLANTLHSSFQEILIIQKGAVALRKVLDFLEEPCDGNGQSMIDEQIIRPRIPLSWHRGDIEFHDLSFAYPTRPNEWALKNANLKFPGGHFTFIVGKSGSGKSTISNLLLRLYEQSHGTIEIDGLDIKKIDRRMILQNIMLVEQTTSLFNDTLEKNITLGMNVEPDELNQACQMSMLDIVVRDLARGLDTAVGSSGVDLSGGETQRVAIARARLRDFPILVLDEALSAQDRVHKTLLLEAIRRWRVGKTTIILTHDFSDIADLDFVYLMDAGKVIECGRKQSLLESCSSDFAQMYRYQCCRTPADDATTLRDNDQPDLRMKSKDINAEVNELYSEMGSPSTVKADSICNIEELSEPVRSSFDLLQANIMRHHRKPRPNVERIDLNAISISTTSNCNDLEQGKNECELLSVKKIMLKLLTTLQDRWLLLVGLVTALIAGTANPLFSFTFSKLLSGLTSSHPDPEATQLATKWSLVVLLVALLDSSFTFLKCYLLLRSAEDWIRTLRQSVFEKMVRQDLSWFNEARNSTSKITTLVLNDLRDLRALASEFLAAFTTLIIVSVCGLVWAFASGWKLSLVCISLIPIFVLFSGFYGGMLQKYEAAYKASIATLEDRFYNAIKRVKTIRCLQLEEVVIGELTNLELSSKSCGRKRAIGTGIGVATSNALTFVTQAILLYFGMKLVLIGEYTSNKMLETLTLLLFTIMTSISLISQIPEISRGQRAATYVFQVLNSPTVVESTSLNRRTKGISVEENCLLVDIQDLRFSYPFANESSIYQNINLKICHLDTVALVGRSGSGKSTLWHLLAHLYPVSENCIRIDGTDVNHWDAEVLRSQIAVVEQQPQFFLGSIYDNLTYGLPRPVDDCELEELLIILGLQEFVESMPCQLRSHVDTHLLSGGQLQRLAIVRALLRKPKLLVLDECTSALDAQHGFIMSEFVKQNLQGTTTLVITHSEQMMRACSRVVTFRKGSIVEDGTFESLAQRQGGELRNILSLAEV